MHSYFHKLIEFIDIYNDLQGGTSKSVFQASDVLGSPARRALDHRTVRQAFVFVEVPTIDGSASNRMPWWSWTLHGEIQIFGWKHWLIWSRSIWIQIPMRVWKPSIRPQNRSMTLGLTARWADRWRPATTVVLGVVMKVEMSSTAQGQPQGSWQLAQGAQSSE